MPDDTCEPDRCVYIVSNGYDTHRCKRDADDAPGPLPLCSQHHSAVYGYWQARNATPTTPREVLCPNCDPEVRLHEVLHQRRILETKRRRESCVYYIQRGDGLIKIGRSANVEQRMAVLRRAHGEIRLLATEPGYQEQEQARHQRFARYREHYEWFRPGPHLMNHIARLARAGVGPGRAGVGEVTAE